MTLDRRSYQSDGEIAATLHHAFVPRLPAVPTIELAAKYTPASHDSLVGGDWYDAFELPDGAIFFSIGDVMGHGSQAAVSMGRARQTLLTLALLEYSPARVLEKSNSVLYFQKQPMTTALCGYFDPRTETITYANAGHPPLIAHSERRGTELCWNGGPPLGTFDDASYRDYHLEAHAGNFLVLYTDGVTEQRRDVLEGEQRLLHAVRGAAAVDPSLRADFIADSMFRDERRRDDSAILVLSFRSTP
jgi:serine phosphatase RsbU (regulator of sigma subunit)